MRPLPLGLDEEEEDKENGEDEAEEEEQGDEEEVMIGEEDMEEPLEIEKLPPPSSMMDPSRLLTSRVVAP